MIYNISHHVPGGAKFPKQRSLADDLSGAVVKGEFGQGPESESGELRDAVGDFGGPDACGVEGVGRIGVAGVVGGIRRILAGGLP